MLKQVVLLLTSFVFITHSYAQSHEEFVEQFKQQMIAQDAQQWSQHIDWNAMNSRGIASQEFAQERQEAVSDQIRRDASYTLNQLTKKLTGKNSVFASQITEDSFTLRLNIGPNQDVLYRFLTHKIGDQYKIIDWFNFSNGHWQTDRSIQIYLIRYLNGEAIGDFSEQFTGGDTELRRTFIDAIAMIRTEEYKKFFKKLPGNQEAYGDSKFMAKLIYQAAAFSSDTNFRMQAIEHLYERFPNDADFAILYIEYQLYKRDLAELQKVIDNAQQKLGFKDSLFEIYTINILLSQNKIKEAKALTDELAEMDPWFEDIWWAKQLIDTKLGLYGEAVYAFDQLVSRFNLDPTMIKPTNDDYKALLSSKEFAAWALEFNKSVDAQQAAQ